MTQSRTDEKQERRRRLDLLRALGRPGVPLTIQPRPDTPGMVTLQSPPGRARTIPRPTLDRAVSDGLVAQAGEAVRLTPAGASWLRRCLSEGDAFQDQHQQRAHRSIEVAPGVRQRALVNDSESPLQWLNRRRDKDGKPMLEPAQFAAGERLRADYTFGELTQRVTSSWSPVASSVRGGSSGNPAELRDNVVAARQRVRLALTAVGPEFAGILVDVCCHLQGLESTEKARGWPQRAGKLVLQMALSSLARHYGISAGAAAPSRVSVGHWGTGDYRPEFPTRPTDES